jgi:SAM-dependent methyltransferase
MTPQQAPDADDARIERERTWHDERFSRDGERGRAVRSFTDGLILEPLERFFGTVRSRCVGKDVLDYGCSVGEASLRVRGYGARSVCGIDLSPVAVEQARAAAVLAGADGVEFKVMNAEELLFPAGSFDLVFGVAILHHLDLHRACSEIGRMLRPDGAAVFLEPLGHNPLINLVRHATPSSRTEDEHPLLVRDLRALGEHFHDVDLQYLNLLTLVSAPLVGVPGRDALRRGLAAVDRLVFRAVPPIRRYAWNVVITMGRPR